MKILSYSVSLEYNYWWHADINEVDQQHATCHNKETSSSCNHGDIWSFWSVNSIYQRDIFKKDLAGKGKECDEKMSEEDIKRWK